MPASTISSESFEFLGADNAMASAIRANAWEQTVFGPVASWPQSLRSALSICLGSSFPIAIYWGRQLGLIYNDDWSPILGSKHPWALGRPAHEVWPEIWETIGPLFESVLITGRATRSKDQLLAMHRHGFTEECYFDYTFSPITGEGGKVEGIFNAVVETTFRVIGERRARLLRDLGEQLANASTVDQACEAIQTVLSHGTYDLPFAIVYLTHEDDPRTLSHATICGIKQDPDVSTNTLPADATGLWPIETVLAGGPSLRFDDEEGRLQALVNNPVWPEPCTSALIMSLPGIDSDHPNGVVIAGISPRIALDAEYQSFLERISSIISAAITRTRAAERERKRAEELANLDRAKTAFFSNASHEFRTPLTLMLAPLREALDRGDSASVDLPREELALMHRNGLRLLKLVNTLLDFSRIEAGRVEAVFEPVDLAQLTVDLASNFRSAMERANLHFAIECPPLRQQFHVDRDLWEKIVLNLVSNAFKYTLEGGVTVRLVEDLGTRSVELQVIDTGVGVPKASLPRLFERFYRIENQRGRTLEGTGIGLALVYELAKIHNGTVSADSILGRGTTVRVRLPAGVEHQRPHEESRRTQPSTSVRAEAYIEEALRWLPDQTGATPVLATSHADDAISERIGLLIVDDNADMRGYLARLFNQHDVRLAADGEEAWRQIEQRVPDLVLTDAMMPKLDGFGLLQRIRSHGQLRHLPVVMLSARAGEEASAEARTAGVDDYVVKPFSARELSLRIDAAWRMARLRRESLAALQSSERMFRAIADQAPVAIWVANSEGLVTYMNRHWYEFTGQGPRRAEGRSWLECVHPDDRERIEADDIDVAKCRRAFHFEYRLKRADGVYRWMLDSGVPKVDANGEFDGFIGTAVDITEHREAEHVLRNSNAMLERQVAERTKEFNTLWQLTPDILAIADHAGRFVNVNPAATTTLGWSKAELLAAPFATFLHPEDKAATAAEYQAQADDGYFTTHFENRYRCKDGSYRWIVWTAVTAGDRVYATGRDVTDAKAQTEALRQAEESLRQASKMEAVGQLTGGIAHDFNNLLTVVIGNLDSLQRRVGAGGEPRLLRSAENAMAGAKRAAALTQRLLAFARRQPLDPKPTDVSRLILSMSDMLTRTLGERIEIETVFGAGLWRVEVDQNQLENALLNLALNARDAMPEGGKLTIETANAHLDEFYVARTSEVAAGQYVVLAVSDTGHGMTPDVLAHVFEPFFTTKPVGFGSGLGLPQVYGFVKQSGGHVKVYSEPGAGTTVKIYLPRISNTIGEDDDVASVSRSVPDSSANETVLVVEDEAGVRDYSCDILRELGYRVLEARDGKQALLLLTRHPEIDVLFTDVGLPGITGRELADRALALNPRLKILFTTGYARNAIVHHGRLDPGVQLLAKPFTYADLAARIRSVIDGGGW